MAKATTVRFTEEMYSRLDQASARTGLPVNSIVIAACLDWLQRHSPAAGEAHPSAHDVFGQGSALQQAPRWATLRRAVELASKPLGRHLETYPFHRFTDHAKELLIQAQVEAEKSGFSYIGTEHLLLACFGNAEFQSAKTLAALGITYPEVGAAIDQAIGDKRPAQRQKIVPTSRVKRVIEIAFSVSGSMGDPRVGTSHLLLALAAEGNGIAGHVLKDLGATHERILSQLTQLSDG